MNDDTTPTMRANIGSELPSHNMFRRGIVKRHLINAASVQTAAHDDVELQKLETCSTSSTCNTSFSTLDDATTSSIASASLENSHNDSVEGDDGIPFPIVMMEDNRMSLPSEQLKTVSFNLDRIEYHESEVTRTQREHDQCWYKDREIAIFRKNSTNAAIKVFGTKKRQLLFGRRQRRGSDGMTTTASGYEEYTVDATKAKRFKQSIAEAYKLSNEIRSEEDFHSGHCPVDRDNLKRAYQQFEQDGGGEDGDGFCLVGLEVYILYGIRGESARQTKYIIQTVRQRMMSSGHGGVGGDKNDNNNPEQRDNLMRLMSQYISLPSRVFVRELAMAQAAVLAEQLERQQQQQHGI